MTDRRTAPRLLAAARKMLDLALRGRFDLIVEKTARRWQGMTLRRIDAAALWQRIEHCESLVLFVDAGLGGGADEYARREIDAHAVGGATVLRLAVNDLTGGAVLLSDPLRLQHAVSIADPDLFRDSRLWSRLTHIQVGTLVGFARPRLLMQALVALRQHTGVPMTVDWHDHYLICPSHLLLDFAGRYCGVPDESRCATCLRQHAAVPESDLRDRGIPAWRSTCGDFLAAASCVRVFSDSSRELLRRAYGSRFDAQLSLRHHAMDYFHAARSVAAVESPLTIAVVGRINLHKGARVLEQLAAEIKARQAPVSIAVVGTIDGEPDPDVVTVYGSYEVNQLPDILESLRVSLVLLPSVCPETFSFVVHEVMAMELPLFTLPLGAQEEFARAYPHGGVASSLQPVSLLDEILEFASARRGEHP